MLAVEVDGKSISALEAPARAAIVKRMSKASVRSRWVLLCSLPIACGPQGGGQSGAEAVDSPEEPAVVPDRPTDPISPGASECDDDDECVEQAESELDALSRPLDDPPSIVASACEVGAVMLETRSVSGSFCDCEHDDGRSTMLGPNGLGCYLFGRGGDCLLSDDDFNGCEVNDPLSCTDACDLLQERLADDAARRFDTRVVEARCQSGACSSIVQIDDQCYVDGSYEQGRAYSCEDGSELIREQHEEDTAPPELIELPPQDANYLPGTMGTLTLTVSTTYSGSYREPSYFGARADFVTVEGADGVFGEVIDPLEGIDDCGVTQTGGTGVAASVEWFAADEVVLVDGDDEHAFEAIDVGFTFYGLDLNGLGVEPRFGEAYGFRASGGTLMGSFETERVQLPEALVFEELSGVSHLDKGELRLTWTGSNQAPLKVTLWALDTLADSFSPYIVDCLVQDDGDFTIPAQVMEAAPDGFLWLSARRRAREIVEDGANAFLIDGDVRTEHRMSFGERCDTPEILEACLASAQAERELRQTCGDQDTSLELPPLEVECPDYLAHACHGCVEFYECSTQNTRCEDGGLVSYSGCACPD